MPDSFDGQLVLFVAFVASTNPRKYCRALVDYGWQIVSRFNRFNRFNSENFIQLYLAGPDVFLPNPLEVARLKQAICQNYGFTGLFPFDVSLDLADLLPVEQGLAIYRSNIALMNRCDLIVANMTPFRGPSMDVGTAFEKPLTKLSKSMPSLLPER